MAVQDPWRPFSNKYNIHPETQEHGRMLLASAVKPYSEIGVEAVRQLALSRSTVISGNVEFDGEETEVFVPSPYTTDGVPVTIYKPTSRPEVPAILVYFHGGGLIACSRKTHEATVKILAQQSGAIILNVEYRLLPNPGAPYAPFEDAEVVARWVLENKEAVGGKSNSKVGVGGDSAGGQLAIGVTNEVPGLDFQILIYPATDTSFSNETFKEFRNVPGLSEDVLKFLCENGTYQIPDYLTNPRVNGMARTNTASSPPALIILAELDPLRGSGIEYAEKLRDAGVKVQLKIIEGVPHGFFSGRLIFKTTSSQAYNYVVKYLNQFQ